MVSSSMSREELVGQVVVGVDVVTIGLPVRGSEATGPVGGRPPPLADSVLDRRHRSEPDGQDPDQGGEVVAVPQAVGVGPPEPYRSLPQDGRVDRGVVDDHGGLREPGPEPVDPLLDRPRSVIPGRRWAAISRRKRAASGSATRLTAPSPGGPARSGCGWTGTPRRRRVRACR